MKFGVAIFATDEAMPIDEVAALVEESGFESLWLPDHTHIPSDRTSPHPLIRDDLPREYARTLDVFVALTAAAGATKQLLLGTGICLVPERDPIVTAKQVASIDLLSNGRFLFGVGAGWNIEEVENHGVRGVDRFKVLDERVMAMKAIWTTDVASFNGRFVSFDRIWSWPKPVQNPHPPLLLGSNGPNAIRRAARLGAHWLPGRHRDDDTLLGRIASYQEQMNGRGGVTLADPPLDARRLSRYAEAGVDRGFFWLPTTLDRQAIERRIEAIQAVVSQV